MTKSGREWTAWQASFLAAGDVVDISCGPSGVAAVVKDVMQDGADPAYLILILGLQDGAYSSIAYRVRETELVWTERT